MAAKRLNPDREEINNLVLFCLARKEPKEHTIIQERSAPLGIAASGTALGIGSWNLFKSIPINQRNTYGNNSKI
jgi:hypothetical protein